MRKIILVMAMVFYALTSSAQMHITLKNNINRESKRFEIIDVIKTYLNDDEIAFTMAIAIDKSSNNSAFVYVIGEDLIYTHYRINTTEGYYRAYSWGVFRYTNMNDIEKTVPAYLVVDTKSFSIDDHFVMETKKILERVINQ